MLRNEDAAGVASSAARLLGELLASSLAQRGRAHLALSGGTTPEGAYRLLTLASWEGVEVWFADERCVGPADPESNYLMAEQTLLDHAPGALVHRIEGERGAEAAAASYDALLRERVAGEPAPVPVLDVIVLGIGEDGHTASLFPNNPALRASGAACLPVHDSPKPPPDRVTLSLEVLNAARASVLLATGAGKADALARALGAGDPAVPSSLLDGSRLTVIADAAALGDA
jgi:6-phosphogluconolactonase